ncbi:bifunctional DNA primase/polymerase [Mycobacterium sp. NPDC003323]
MSSEPNMLAHAIEYAQNGWAVGPLCHRDRKTGRVLHLHGKDPFGRLVPHGVLDFSTDVQQVTDWWAQGEFNIGARVPDSMFVLDVDSLDALAELETSYEPLPETLTTISGREAGGKHLYFRRPQGKLSYTRLPKGLEIKTSAGYTVQAPSIHPASGQQYRRIDGPVAAPPSWLVALLRPEPKPVVSPSPRPAYSLNGGRSIADEFTVKASWATILEIHGWRCIDADPDVDGARWLHPAATSKCSATIKNGCLFVYSPNTPFDITESGNPRGYTKFRAYAVLDHGGDMKAAARSLRDVAARREVTQ